MNLFNSVGVILTIFVSGVLRKRDWNHKGIWFDLFLLISLLVILVQLLWILSKSSVMTIIYSCLYGIHFLQYLLLQVTFKFFKKNYKFFLFLDIKKAYF
jgi:hypothetical protein